MCTVYICCVCMYVCMYVCMSVCNCTCVLCIYVVCVYRSIVNNEKGQLAIYGILTYFNKYLAMNFTQLVDCIYYDLMYEILSSQICACKMKWS